MENSLSLHGIKRSLESSSAYKKTMNSRIWAVFSREVHHVIVNSFVGSIQNAQSGYGVCMTTQFPTTTNHCYMLDTDNQQQTYERLVRDSMAGAVFVDNDAGKDLVVVVGGAGGFYVGKFPIADLSAGKYKSEKGAFDLMAVPGGHGRIYRDVSVVYAKNNKLLVYCKSSNLVFNNEEKFEPFVVDLDYTKTKSRAVWSSVLLDNKGCDDTRIFDGYKTTLVHTKLIDDGLFYGYFLESFSASRKDDYGHKSGLFMRVDPIVYDIDSGNKHLSFYRCGDCSDVRRQYLPESMQASNVGSFVAMKSWIFSHSFPNDLVTSVGLSKFKAFTDLLSINIELSAPICKEKPVPETALTQYIIRSNKVDIDISDGQHNNTLLINNNNSTNESIYHSKTLSALMAILAVCISIAAGVVCFLGSRRRCCKGVDSVYSRLELSEVRSECCESNSDEICTSLADTSSMQGSPDSQNTTAGFGIESSPMDVANL